MGTRAKLAITAVRNDDDTLAAEELQEVQQPEMEKTRGHDADDRASLRWG
jgi:hypothetical protein